MHAISHDPNPFALMLDPQSVVDAMDRSEHLASLHRQIFRPLDKPTVLVSDMSDIVRDFDDAIDFGPDLDD